MSTAILFILLLCFAPLCTAYWPLSYNEIRDRAKNYKLRPGYMIVEAKDFEYGKLFKAQLLNSGAPPSPTELDVKQCKKLWLKVPAGGGIWWHDIKDEDEETSNLSTSGIARVKKEFVVMCLK